MATFINNSAEIGGGAFYHDTSIFITENSSTLFIGNVAAKAGGAIFSEESYTNVIQSSKVIFKHNTAGAGGSIYLSYKGNVTIEGNSVVIFERNQANYSGGGAIYAGSNSIFLLCNNSAVICNDNKAVIGGVFHITDNSAIKWKDDSIAMFTNNSAVYGGGIFAGDKSDIYFDKSSTVTFINNSAGKFGGAIYIETSAAFTFQGNCRVIFNSNIARQGGGVYLLKHSAITFKENSTIEFNNNNATEYGGAIYSTEHSIIHFEGKSLTTFSNNKALQCGAVCLNEYNVTFEEASEGIFAYITVASIQNSSVIFKKNCKVVFSDNQAKVKGGAIGCFTNTYIAIIDNSSVLFDSNRTQIGGAIYFSNQSNFTTDDYSSIKLHNNAANSGGSLFIENYSISTFKGNSLVQFNTNRATENGGTIMSQHTSVIRFEEQSKVTFEENTATLSGGAIYNVDTSDVFFTQYSTVLFYNNTATFGANIYTKYNSYVSITTNSTVRFNNNIARWYGGVPYSNKHGYADITFDSNGTITCSDPVTLPVCIHQNCFCQAIDYVLASLTNNTQIDLSINVTLSSVITISGVNISIIGHHNPTINCSNGGGLKFSYCHNCTIEGITWDGCGAKNINSSNIPVIEFYHSSNITIQNCTFQYSVGQAIVLSEVSGNVGVNHCYFLYNKQYKGYGTAVCFSTSNNFQEHIQLIVKISNCIFSNNEGIYGIVYISQCGKKTQKFLLSGSTFSSNKGTSLYLSNQNLHLLDNVIFHNNKAEYGAGIFISDHSTITFSENSIVTFNQNTANNSGGAIFLTHFSSAIFEANCLVIFNNNMANHYGGSIASYNNSYIVLKGNSSVQFNKNTAKLGGVLYIEANSVITTTESPSVTFNANKADLGGAVYITGNSSALFKTMFFTLFNYDITNLHDTAVSFYSTYNYRNKIMMSTFINNYATQGGAICIRNKSILQFEETSSVIFMNNKAMGQGGAISCHDNSKILFEEKSNTMFIDNKAEFGGAIYLKGKTTIIFKGSSLTEFTANEAEQNGGAVFSVNSKGIFKENSTVRYINNIAKGNGGAVCSIRDSDFTFDEYCTCTVTFHNNKATQGGAVYCYNNTIMTTNGNSSITFANNTALEQGGALVVKHNADVKFKKHSTVIFDSNKAIHNGGSVFLEIKSVIYFEEQCGVIFDSNTADDGTGGAISTDSNSLIEFKDNSTITFCHNNATQGGAIFSLYNLSLIFSKNTKVIFNDNAAAFGGALNFYSHSLIRFQGGDQSTVAFKNNKATQNGGAIYLQKNSYVTFKGTLTVNFYNNEATLGGAINCNSNSDITCKENPHIIFLQNNAKLGGAIYTVMSNIAIIDNSKLIFTDNIALQDGGAMFLDKQFKVTLTDNAEITFKFNTASDYGGAIYSRVDQSVINFNVTKIHFVNNYARTAGSSVFINVPILCNSSCLNNSVLGVTEGSLQYNQLSKHITTSLRKLELYKPTECIDNSSVGCYSYYVKNIMLGQEILIDACIYDYYNRPTGTKEFLVSSDDDQDYYIPGSRYILISCNHTFQGISIIGKNTTPILPFNYSIAISLYVVRISEMKTVSVNLIIELSPCHPGFWYDNTTQKCECYNSTSIVLCSGSSSTIKKGYWFGTVTGKPTVTFCPIDYCNFTCCETISAYYHLSPVRENQCMLHRSGTACGDCEVGYSLSFDSTECISVRTCTIRQTILLVILIIFYWIAITVAVFVMMYFKVEIGYLYGITYYYSIVDILLSQNWFLSSKKLYTLINVMSSITKITPQFLGQICLMQGMNGIDQQFIHYIHPLAVVLIIVSIICLARKSRRLSFFIRKGIIRFICFLLLLSYTSVATTSLLLLRPLTFHNVDKTYTYLSPDIEYFHGRHLVYGIVAVLFIIVIVIGLPFLLLFEPLLNRKINFVKLKPLLDQFQGCYKDKYRCFAAYYMICRLVIIIIIIVNSPNDFTAHYFIITACVITALLHQHCKPYADNYLNFFDGNILHLTILISFLPLVEFFDSFDSNLITGTIYVLLLLPLMGLTIMKLWIHRNNIRMMIVYCNTLKCKHSRNNDEIPLNDCEIQMLKEVIVDDNMRRNAIIVDV